MIESHRQVLRLALDLVPPFALTSIAAKRHEILNDSDQFHKVDRFGNVHLKTRA